MSDADRNTGLGLVIGGAIAGGFSGVLFWLMVSGETKKHPEPNIGLLVFGCIVALLAVFLIGYGIKKIVAAAA